MKLNLNFQQILGRNSGIRAIASVLLGKRPAIPADLRAQGASLGALARKLEIPSLPNAACITPTLYRGAQPGREGYAELKKLGIEIVVNFRSDKDEVQTEQRHVESLGVRFISLPWSSWRDPQRDEIISFFSVLRENPGRKVFAHCEYGADRTGLMIALYRLVEERWTPKAAVAEMKAFNYHYILYSHLAKFVVGFPAFLAADPSFASIINTPEPRAIAPAQSSSDHKN